MVPEFSVSGGVRYAFPRTSASLDARWVGEQFLVGDEGNESPFRKLDRYLIVDLKVEHRVGRAIAFLEVSNLLDQNYSPFGIISRNVRGTPGQPGATVERFLTPGLPRRLSIGLRVGDGR